MLLTQLVTSTVESRKFAGEPGPMGGPQTARRGLRLLRWQGRHLVWHPRLPRGQQAFH